MVDGFRQTADAEVAKGHHENIQQVSRSDGCDSGACGRQHNILSSSRQANNFLLSYPFGPERVGYCRTIRFSAHQRETVERIVDSDVICDINTLKESSRVEV
jgi:hypothetical protein